MRTPDDAELLNHSERDLAKKVDSLAKARRRLRKQLDKRIKTRDTATDMKNDNIEKKEGQVYFDGTIYTARWSSLPS